MSPFDPKSALLAKHAQHVVLIHFPIALFVAGIAFDLIALWRQSRGLATAVYYNLTAAAISTLPAAATGVLAWQWQLDGTHLKGILLLHLIFGVFSTALIWIVWWLHFRAHCSPEGRLPAYRLPIELVSVPLIGLTGHLRGLFERSEYPDLASPTSHRWNEAYAIELFNHRAPSLSWRLTNVVLMLEASSPGCRADKKSCPSHRGAPLLRPHQAVRRSMGSASAFEDCCCLAPPGAVQSPYVREDALPINRTLRGSALFELQSLSI